MANGTERGYVTERSVPGLVLLACLIVTVLLWQNANRTSLQEQKAVFDASVADIDDRIHRRIEYYAQVLHGARAFYINQRMMEREEFRGYIAALELWKNFPGIQAISYAPFVSDRGKQHHVSAMRRSGVLSYAIRPEGGRGSYAPVSYIEPFDERNARVLGFDNLSNPERRKALELARDEDRVVISEKLILKQEDAQNQQNGFLMFLPVFRKGMTQDTLESRRANIEGWFAAAFRFDDLMVGVLGPSTRGIALEIFDGSEISSDSRMFGLPQAEGARYVSVSPIELGGRRWSMRLSSLPEFETARDRSGERNALVTGGLICLLLPFVTWLLMHHRGRAQHMHQEIGRESEMRRLAERRISDLHLFNETILEKSPSGIAVFLGSGACVMANTAYARSIGAVVDDVLKQDFRNNDSWKRNGLLAYAEQAFESGQTIRQDIEGVTSFGKLVVLECIFVPLSISGEPHLLLITNDVSERVAAERALTESMQKLEEKELAKTRFLAAAGHDLRQPLAAANLFIDALKLTEPSSRQEQILERLDQSMATFNGLLDALLNVSKLDAGMIKPELSDIQVGEVFNWLEQNFAPMAKEKQIGFRLYFPLKQQLVMRSDEGLLRSVLMNLVSNAIKFTWQGAVLVSARRRGRNILIQVWDTGIGMEESELGHIFDEFYQVNNSQRDRAGGLGLGLSIAKRAMALLSGEIRCRSRVQRGSVFELYIPMGGNDEQIVRPADTPSEMDVSLFARGKRFVVVEDDGLVAQAMVNWLEGAGGEVHCFHSAEDALNHAHIERADYYVADYMLGGALNGIQFLNLVRHRRRAHLNAVLVTGDTSTSFIRQAVECDWPVLHKPINTAKLAAVLYSQMKRGGSSV